MRINNAYHVQIYVRSMGKMLAVTEIFDNVDDANKWMEKHREQAVVAEIPPLVLLANVYDKGQPQ